MLVASRAEMNTCRSACPIGRRRGAVPPHARGYRSWVQSERRERRAARVVVLSHDRYVLLRRGGDPQRPEAGTWWFTPGGGIEVGETPEDAARRELEEETGLEQADLGPVVFERLTVFEFDGVTYEQSEDYFLIRTDRFEVDSSRWSPVEVATVEEHRWWPVDELRTTDAVVYPEGLVDLLDRTL